MNEFDAATLDDGGGFSLRDKGRGDAPPVLVAAEVLGRIEGVLLALTLRQTYRNAGPRNLELVYTFPLATEAVLLGFGATLDGHHLEGVILSRPQAEREYEDALADGDTPVLLEALPGGRYTANIGNLLPGQQIVLEIRLAQLLRLDQGRLRVALPTTIAPRHGRPAAGGLLPHQVPVPTLETEIPLTLELRLAGALAAGNIDCPTHAHRQTRDADGVLLNLAPGAALDRDVVFTVTPRQAQPALLTLASDAVGAANGAGRVALAAFSAPPGPARAGLRLKLLVDCSGSMVGDSIESARRALLSVIGGLGRGDRVSLTRFGSTVERVTRMSAVTPKAIAELCQGVDDTEASLGGTEMAAALLALMGERRRKRPPMAAGEIAQSTASLQTEVETGDVADASRHGAADILLITDGEVWNTHEVMMTAREAGHRIFAIGVGSAPAEDLLRPLAEFSGGACEFATLGEAMQDAALRMLARIRQQPWSDLRVDWGATPRWQLPLPGTSFGGDMVLALAGFDDGAPPAASVTLFGMEAGGTEQRLSCAQADAPSPGQTLARIAAARRLPGLPGDEVEAMALAYALLSERTHCVLVHRRTGEDKAVEAASLHRVRSMLAAGWGGMGSVGGAQVASQMLYRRSYCRDLAYNVMPKPAVAAAKPSLAPLVLNNVVQSSRAPAATTDTPTAAWPTLSDLADRVVEVLAIDMLPGELPAAMADQALHPALAGALAELRKILDNDAQLWLALALWVTHRSSRDGNLHLAATLASHTSAVPTALRARVAELLEHHLGAYASDGWESARERRLAAQMRQD